MRQVIDFAGVRPFGEAQRGRRIQRSDCAFLCCARWGDLCFQSCDDLSRVERVILHLDHLCYLDSAGYRLQLVRHGGPAAGSGAVRNRSRDSQTETAYTQEHSVDERTGCAASRLNVCPRMRWQFKRPDARISGHLDGDGYIRLAKPFHPCNHHHQLKQNSPGRVALRCPPCPGSFSCITCWPQLLHKEAESARVLRPTGNTAEE